MQFKHKTFDKNEERTAQPRLNAQQNLQLCFERKKKLQKFELPYLVNKKFLSFFFLRDEKTRTANTAENNCVLDRVLREHFLSLSRLRRCDNKCSRKIDKRILKFQSKYCNYSNVDAVVTIVNKPI